MSCPFCHTNQSEIIFQNQHCFSMYDHFPVSTGHTLIIPKRHISNYFDLSQDEQCAIIHLLNLSKTTIEFVYKPDGYNIGINIGKSAGQTVFHVHVHLIPRYYGDVNDPSGGVRGVIPNKKTY